MPIDDVAPRRELSVDAYRVCAAVLVVVGHWLAASMTYHVGQFRRQNVLADLPWTQWLALILQVVPVFFLVAGSIALCTSVRGSFNGVVTRVGDALSKQGFGVLTEIDMKATVKAKLDEDMEDYLILGRAIRRWPIAQSTSTVKSGCFCPATS